MPDYAFKSGQTKTYANGKGNFRPFQNSTKKSAGSTRFGATVFDNCSCQDGGKNHGQVHNRGPSVGRISNAGTSDGATKGWETRHHGGGSVLPIGAVHLASGENEMFGHIYNGWEKDKGVNILMRRQGAEHDGPLGLKAVHTYGSDTKPQGYNPGDTIDLKHDQTFRDMGRHVVVGEFPHTDEGMKQMQEKAGKKSLPFYTFK